MINFHKVFELSFSVLFSLKHYNAAPLLHVFFTITFTRELLIKDCTLCKKGKKLNISPLENRVKTKLFGDVGQIKTTTRGKFLPCSSSFTKNSFVFWFLSENVFKNLQKCKCPMWIGVKMWVCRCGRGGRYLVVVGWCVDRGVGVRWVHLCDGLGCGRPIV